MSTLSKEQDDIDATLYHVGRSYPRIVGDKLVRLLENGQQAYSPAVYANMVFGAIDLAESLGIGYLHVIEQRGDKIFAVLDSVPRNKAEEMRQPGQDITEELSEEMKQGTVTALAEKRTQYINTIDEVDETRTALVPVTLSDGHRVVVTSEVSMASIKQLETDVLIESAKIGSLLLLGLFISWWLSSVLIRPFFRDCLNGL